MSRTVCGICWCPYDDDTGACACEPELKAQHMTDLRTAAQQALEALEGKRYTACGWRSDCDKAITALRAALAEPVQQGCDHCNHPLYAAVKCRVCGRVTQAEPVAPPEAKTEAEITAYCAGWWAAITKIRESKERNFCPRCGKRTRDIHTCTPPGDCDVHG